MNLYTVGHSTHPIGRFLALLEQHEIRLLVDVRSVPRSRRHPQFNREALAASLKDAGVEYEFLGRELGARAEDPLLCENGRVSYSRLAATGLFQFGLDKLLVLGASKRAAIMCAEKEPLDCHRTLLVARAIDSSWRARVHAGLENAAAADGGPPVEAAGGIEILHIHADGTLESHRDCLRRLVEASKLPPGDLFRSEEERIAEACRLREEKVAFRR